VNGVSARQLQIFSATTRPEAASVSGRDEAKMAPPYLATESELRWEARRRSPISRKTRSPAS
jgi:hypothetical protein